MDREMENRIIDRVLRGDTDAFEGLVLAYEKKAYSIALRLTGSREDAADVVQEAFLKAYRNLASFRGESSFSSWFYRIVTNLCTDLLRARRPVDSLTVENEEGEEAQLEIPDCSAAP